MRIQSLVRGYLIRKMTSEYRSAERRTQLLKWQQTYKSLTEGLREFLSRMRYVKESFLLPIERDPPHGTENSYAYLNMHNAQFISVHEGFLQELHQMQQSVQFPFRVQLGSCLRRNIVRLRKVYKLYAHDFQVAVEALDHFCRTVSTFSALFGSEKQEEFASLLKLPSVYLPSLHGVLNTLFLCKNTSDADALFFGKSVESLRQLCQETNKIMETNAVPENTQRIRRVLVAEWRIKHATHPLQLLRTKRQLVREGVVRVDGKKTDVFLFNDLIILTERFPRSTSFRYLQEISLHQAAMTEVSDREFTLYLADSKESFRYRFRKSDAQNWLDDISSAIDQFVENRVFGAGLDTLLEREKPKDGIPLVLKNTLSWVATHAADTEGIFRVPADSGVTRQLRLLYDSGNASEIDFETISIHTVGGLAKLFLREMPAPLVPFELFQQVIDLEKQKNLFNEQQYVPRVVHLLHEVPRQRLRILHFLLCFLRDFSRHAAATKMDSSNLSMVFAPAVIRPPVEDLDSAMKNINSISFVGFLLRYHDQIWSEVIVPRTKNRTHRASCHITRSSRKSKKVSSPTAHELEDIQSIKAQGKMHLELPTRKPSTKTKSKSKRNSPSGISPISARATSTDPGKMRARKEAKKKRVVSARFATVPNADQIVSNEE